MNAQNTNGGSYVDLTKFYYVPTPYSPPGIPSPNFIPPPVFIPQPNPGICPGCGRCKECGRPAAPDITITWSAQNS